MLIAEQIEQPMKEEEHKLAKNENNYYFLT